MESTNKIAVVGLIISLVANVFMGMSLSLQAMGYSSDQASKRAQLGIFTSAGQYEISQNTSSNLYEAILNVSGVIANDGPTTCQINQLSLNVTLHLTSSMKRYNNLTSVFAQTIGYSDTFMNSSLCLLGWNSSMLDINSQKTFNITMPITNLDNRYPNLQSCDIQGSIFLQYTDDYGMLTKNQLITDWVQISASPQP